MAEHNQEALRKSNVALATQIMQRFGCNMEGWYDNLHEDIVMEFPFGSSVGMPERAEGKEACSAVFATVCEVIKVRFFNVRIHEMADPNQLLVEYEGHSDPVQGSYDQKYICVQTYKDDKLIFFREYWNSKVVFDLFGDLSALGE